MKIVQCWDDGVVDDIRLIGILRRHGAKASFNLNFAAHGEHRRHSWTYAETKPVWKLARSELCSVYDGFLVANHTLSHPNLTAIPRPQAEREIREGKDRLEQHFGYPVHGFAYPFGAHNPEAGELVRQAGHCYGRTIGRAVRVWPPDDASAFHPSCHFRDAGFWARYKLARSAGDIFYFWGHSYEMVTEDQWQACEDLIARISADPEAEWAWLPELFVARVQH